MVTKSAIKVNYLINEILMNTTVKLNQVDLRFPFALQ